MALYGVYGSHSTESCPLNDRNVAERLVAFAEKDIASLASNYKINQVVAQYHSALEHTFLWVVDGEDPHLIQQFCIDAGVASFNAVKIVPLIRFNEDVIPLIRRVHDL